MDQTQDPRNFRKDWLYSASSQIAKGLLGEVYNFSYVHQERLYPLKDRPCILLPNHQSWLDIPLVGVLLKDVLDRPAFYVMKSSLPDVMKYLGGISIIRPQDTRRRKGKRPVQPGMPTRRKNEVYTEILPELINGGEIVVIYPEGQRNHVPVRHIGSGTPRENLRKVLHVQELVREIRHDPTFTVSLVPLDFQYGDTQKRLGSRITIVVGNPIEVDNDGAGLEQLTNHLISSIECFER